jgi:hypothetical protein
MCTNFCYFYERTDIAVSLKLCSSLQLVHNALPTVTQSLYTQTGNTAGHRDRDRDRHSAVFHSSGLEKHIRLHRLTDTSVACNEHRNKRGRINTSRSERNISTIKNLSSYRAVNTLRLGYKNQSVNAV